MSNASSDSEILARLSKVIESRKNADPDTSYVASLFERGRAKIAEKVGEEAVETVIAGVSGDKDDIKSEAADLLFHLMILLADAELDISDVLAVLAEREGISGLSEKAARR